MTIRERSTWLMASTIAVVYGWYFATILGRLGHTPVEEIEYLGLIVLTTLAVVALAATSHALLGVATAQASSPTPPDADGARHRARSLGGYVLAGGSVAGLSLAAFGFDRFWIVNTLLAGLVLAELVAAVAEIAALRREVSHAG